MDKIVPTLMALIKWLNDSKVLLSFCALNSFLGSSEIVAELYASCRNIYTNHLMQQFVIFSIMQIYTRDIVMSLFITAMLVLLYPQVLMTDGFTEKKCDNK